MSEPLTMELDGRTLVDLMNVSAIDQLIAAVVARFPSSNFKDLNSLGLRWCKGTAKITAEPKPLDLMGRNPNGYLCVRHVSGSGDVVFYRKADNPMSGYLALKPNGLLWTSPPCAPVVAASTGEIIAEYLFIETPEPVPFFLIKRPFPMAA